ncbi:hypothetical protein BGX26_009316 [Mortierella sp. AD094]|nr:hypothetical protein BGX26_009316 [Mortierella sp. AD094]
MNQQHITFPPEVLLLISHFLEQNELSNCALVCKEWNGMFTPALFRQIRISLSGYHTFTQPVTLQKATKYADNIRSIDAPHPSFASLLLGDVVTTGHAEPWFPNLISLSVSFDQNIFRFLRPPYFQPRFLYPSDSEDNSDMSNEDPDSENDHDDVAAATWEPMKGVYSDLWAHGYPICDVIRPTQDPYDIIRLIRQCPNLRNLKIHVRTLGNTVGLYHLLWPGSLPQSIEKLELIVPDCWNEESHENSVDEDYDPSLNPIRDVEEEYEDDDDDGDVDNFNNYSEDDYDEDEVVEWYRSEIRLPQYPEFRYTGWPEYFRDAPRQPLLNLREIAMTNIEEVRNLVLKFIEYFCPHLRSMHLISPSDRFCQNFGYESERIARELEDLKIELRVDRDYMEYFGEEFMAIALGGARWKTISIKNYFVYGWNCMAALMRKASSIEVLDLGVNAGSLTSGFVQRFLAAAPRLRVFAGEALYFLAQFAVQQPWACAETLEVFRCQILLEIPLIDSSIEPPPLVEPARQALVINEEGDVIQGEAYQANESLSHRELQQRVMKQLGRCFQLQELDLSHWKSPDGEIRSQSGFVRTASCLILGSFSPSIAYNDPKKRDRVNANVQRPWLLKTQNKCLRFTFETGLQELEGLKDLRKLNLTGLNHRVSVEELKWMRKAWPKLEQLDGLFNDNESFDDEDGVAREDRRKRNKEMRDWLTGSAARVGDRTFWRTSKLDELDRE